MDGTALSDKEWEQKRVDALMELKRQLLTRFARAGLEEIRDQNLPPANLTPEVATKVSTSTLKRLVPPHRYADLHDKLSLSIRSVWMAYWRAGQLTEPLIGRARRGLVDVIAEICGPAHVFNNPLNELAEVRCDTCERVVRKTEVRRSRCRLCGCVKVKPSTTRPGDSVPTF